MRDGACCARRFDLVFFEAMLKPNAAPSVPRSTSPARIAERVRALIDRRSRAASTGWSGQCRYRASSPRKGFGIVLGRVHRR
ncbi:hypothetical protein [Lysobacter capsici]|uniref:hypothetical protein n=1 Tax=Lysobacter capsici TaxID=435897 RepID=UPI001C003F99|nr:hypothetical protein [Lysobacter capsici]QWF15978.1 hypothetical protein KME82_19725 [Lysobacter capsici]